MSELIVTLTWFEESDDDDEVEMEEKFPAKLEVCWKCEGHGTHLTPSIGEHAYSSEEFYESFDDEESREQYFKRGGIYDVTCHECKGRNVLPVVDESAFNEEQKAMYARFVVADEERARHDAECREEARMERMMGC